jgi:general secretion pathway protein G
MLEFAIVLVIVSALVAILLDRAQANLESAERMVMERQAREIGSALNYQVAKLVGLNQQRELDRLAKTNPVDWLPSKPSNYLGEFSATPQGKDVPGNWFFDTETRELVYVVHRGERFVPDASGRKHVRYSVLLVTGPATSTNGRQITGVQFQPVVTYVWN